MFFFPKRFSWGGGLSCWPFGECPVLSAPLLSALQVGSQCHCNDYCQCQPLFWGGRRWPGWKISLSHWLWIELTWMYLPHMTDNPSPPFSTSSIRLLYLVPASPPSSRLFLRKNCESKALHLLELRSFLYIFACVKRDRLLSMPSTLWGESERLPCPRGTNDNRAFLVGAGCVLVWGRWTS